MVVGHMGGQRWKNSGGSPGNAKMTLVEGVNRLELLQVVEPCKGRPRNTQLTTTKQE